MGRIWSTDGEPRPGIVTGRGVALKISAICVAGALTWLILLWAAASLWTWLV